MILRRHGPGPRTSPPALDLGRTHLHWTLDRPQGQALPLVSFTNSVMVSLPQSFRPNTKLPIHFKVCLAKLLKFYVFLAMSNDFFCESHEPGPGTCPPALDLGQAHLHWILDLSQGQAHLGERQAPCGPGTGPPGPGTGPPWTRLVSVV